MNVMYPNIDLEKRCWVISKIIALRNEIPNRVQNQTGFSDPKIIKYLKKAFSRWIFNIIRKGKNPFTSTDPVVSTEFVLNDDMIYLFQIFNKSDLLCKIDWTWLDKDFHRIAEGPKHTLIASRVTISQKDNFILLTRQDFKFKLHLNQYNNCIRLANNDNHINANNINEYIFVLLFQYKGISGHNNHCSVPQDVIKFTKAKTELFGSPLNTCLDQYCSPFYDIEKYFGSLGSFFDFQLETGTYIMNPPYDEELMIHASKQILKQLRRTTKEITIIVVYPLWDQKSQLEHRGTVHEHEKFIAYDLLKNSKYLRSSVILSHDNHKFYDYFNAVFKTVADVHLMIISNTTYQITAQEIGNYWLNHCN